MGWGVSANDQVVKKSLGHIRTHNIDLIGCDSNFVTLGFSLKIQEVTMKKKSWIILLSLLMMASLAMAATVKVITQEGMIRKEKRFFASVVTRVPYGEMVEELERQGDWLWVSYRGKQGWIHISAVQEQKFRLSSLTTEKAEETSREEVALAGKGFTPEVEKAFRDQNPKMRYDLVDQIQSYKIQDQQLQAFIQAGNLKEPGGAS
jgi:hypothetical protein